MSFLKDKRKRRIFLAITIPVTVLLIIFIACAVYLSDYYRADYGAVDAYLACGNTERCVLDSGTVVYKPDAPIAGLIFYPGGKVEYKAYEPLMQTLADGGILCALVEMPFNLAVFNVNGADGIRELYPEVERWYIGGHSLGGSMAASYLSDNRDNFDGLILLGSYSTEDFSDGSLDVLSVYGSEDGVLNREKYGENFKNLPKDAREVVIDGGCHAYFGMYGNQDGDGTPKISCEEQIEITADVILTFIGADS